MRQAIIRLSIVLLGAAALPGANVSGAEIYKWVGIDGVTHFTGNPPGTDLAGVEVLEFAQSEPAAKPARDYRSMLAVANDMEASRLERERLRLEKQKLLLESRQARQSAYNGGYTDTRVYFPLSYRYPRKPHTRLHGPGRPLRPAPLSSRHGYRARHHTPQARVNLDR